LGFIVQGYSGGSGATAHLSFDGYTAFYLEAAPANMATDLAWASNVNDFIPGLSQNQTDQTDWAIGRGRMNTAIIIAHGIVQSYIPPATPAASACAEHATGGKTDWFLPSKDELATLEEISGQYGIPNSGDFWSSSQLMSNFVWDQNFNSGIQGTSDKSNTYSVRAVRAF
jgi:hypothetical protein